MRSCLPVARGRSLWSRRAVHRAYGVVQASSAAIIPFRDEARRRAIVACALLAACSAAHNEAEATVVVPPSDARITWMGRVDLRDANAARMGWPATAFALRFRGTSIVLRLSDVPRQDETPDADWISVSLDDAPARAFRLRRGNARYPVARGLAPGEHTLVVAKRTEAEVGVVELRGVELGPRTQLLRGPRVARDASRCWATR